MGCLANAKPRRRRNSRLVTVRLYRCTCGYLQTFRTGTRIRNKWSSRTKRRHLHQLPECGSCGSKAPGHWTLCYERTGGYSPIGK